MGFFHKLKFGGIYQELLTRSSPLCMETSWNKRWQETLTYLLEQAAEISQSERFIQLALFAPIADISVHDSIFTFVKWGHGYKIKYYKIYVYAT